MGPNHSLKFEDKNSDRSREILGWFDKERPTPSQLVPRSTFVNMLPETQHLFCLAEPPIV